MSEERLNAIKAYYNYNLKRFNNGCNYCSVHKNEIDKWLPELFKIYSNMNKALNDIAKCEELKSENIRNGFKL